MAIGVPGSSNALEIARRYGIPPTVIAAAREALPEHSRSFEKLVAKLDEATRAARDEQTKLLQQTRTLEEQQTKLEARRRVLEARDAKQLGKDAQRLVDQVRELQGRVDDAKKALRSRPEEDSVKQASDAVRDGGALLGEIDAHRRSLEPEPVETAALNPANVRIGDRVWVERLRSVAEVVDGPARGKVRVSAGMMKLWVDSSDLRALKEAADSTPRARTEVSGAHVKPRRPVRTSDNTLDVRGLRADDAVALAESFLDRMYGAAEPNAFIVHGVGSGALRQAIHAHLSRDVSYVLGFREATQEEGGPQVTVVSLK
jgi:DNA mismatch repair protein MutS2